MSEPWFCEECQDVHPLGCHGHTKIRDENNRVIGRRACRASPMKGAVVCGAHGGHAPQVRGAAAMRLQDLVDPALQAIKDILEREGVSDAAKVSAAMGVLDRYGPTAKVSKQEISGPEGGPIETSDVSEERRRAALEQALRDPSKARRLDRVARDLHAVPDPNPDEEAG